MNPVLLELLTCGHVSCLRCCAGPAGVLQCRGHSLLHHPHPDLPRHGTTPDGMQVCTVLHLAASPSKIRVCAAVFAPSRHRCIHCSLQQRGCVFACVTSVSQGCLFTKLLIHQKGAGCVVFMTHRPLADAVLKKTTMSFLGCWFGKGLGLNHTVYCLKGRDGILNAIFFKFHFLPERQAGLQLTCSSSDFSGCSHYLF